MNYTDVSAGICSRVQWFRFLESAMSYTFLDRAKYFREYFRKGVFLHFSPLLRKFYFVLKKSEKGLSVRWNFLFFRCLGHKGILLCMLIRNVLTPSIQKMGPKNVKYIKIVQLAKFGCRNHARPYWPASQVLPFGRPPPPRKPLELPLASRLHHTHFIPGLRYKGQMARDISVNRHIPPCDGVQEQNGSMVHYPVQATGPLTMASNL